MARRTTIVALAPMFILGLGALARAQSALTPPPLAPTPPAPARPAQVSAAATPASPARASAPPAQAPTPPAPTPALPAEEPTPPAETPPPTAEDGSMPLDTPPPVAPFIPPHFGGAFRARWITLPHWFFGMFTKANQALSSYGIGFEGFRRKRDAENPNRFWEISLGLSYQNMSPPDGNWLGKGHDAGLDTDWVQFKNFGFWTVDLSFIQRQFFNDVFGIHYGAGLGLAIVQGDILRTSSLGCTDQNLGTCRPRVCAGGVCTEAELAATQGTTDNGPGDPHRFKERSVPGAIPVLNLLVGFDFRIPQAPGLEFRLEGGFFNAFFVGGGVAYIY